MQSKSARNLKNKEAKNENANCWFTKPI